MAKANKKAAKKAAPKKAAKKAASKKGRKSTGVIPPVPLIKSNNRMY